jgi:hypothetical protein
MADLTHEDIESAYRPATDVMTRLPNTTNSREVKRLLEVAEALTHQVREEAKRSPEAASQD